MQSQKERLKEKEDRAKHGRTFTRMQRAIRAFAYVWPQSPTLRARLVGCFVLVIAERGVNLAVPVLYKSMVDRLGSASSGLTKEALKAVAAGDDVALLAVAKRAVQVSVCVCGGDTASCITACPLV